jgi:hypothetical protein
MPVAGAAKPLLEPFGEVNAPLVLQQWVKEERVAWMAL